MRTLLLIAILVISTNFAFAECTEYLQAFNKHQLVMKGLMDLNFQGKMNDSILDDYGFDKSFGEAPAPENEKSTDSGSKSSSNEAGAPVESSSTSSGAASSSSDDAVSQPANE